MLFTLLALATVVAAAPLESRQAPASYYIHPNGDNSRCLGVKSVSNGNLVEIQPCNKNVLQRWDIAKGDGKVTLAGSNPLSCLDAGIDPKNNVLAKIWQCLDVPQQRWFYTGDNRIAITGGNQCLDLGPSGPQTYQCTPFNTNQIWTVEQATSGPGPESSSVLPPASSSSAAPPTPSGTTGVKINPNGNTGLCFTVQAGPPVVGSPVGVAACNAANSVGQNFLINRGDGLIKLANNAGLCLDAGVNPSNFGSLKLWTCYPGLTQQQWFYTGDNRIAITGGNQCIDYNGGSGILSTYQCTPYNTNQIFTTSA